MHLLFAFRPCEGEMTRSSYFVGRIVDRSCGRVEGGYWRYRMLGGGGIMPVGWLSCADNTFSPASAHETPYSCSVRSPPPPTSNCMTHWLYACENLCGCDGVAFRRPVRNINSPINTSPSDHHHLNLCVWVCLYRFHPLIYSSLAKILSS